MNSLVTTVGDAVEVARAGRRPPSVSASAPIGTVVWNPAGYIDRRGGRVDRVDAVLARRPRVGVDRARVVLEVVRPVELQRVDEDRHDDAVGDGAGRARSARDGPRCSAPIVGTSAIVGARRGARCRDQARHRRPA